MRKRIVNLSSIYLFFFSEGICLCAATSTWPVMRFTWSSMRLPELVASSGEICWSWGKGPKCPQNVYLDFT